MEINQATLMSLIHYDLETGIFRWKSRPSTLFKSERACNSWNGKYSGEIAGCKNDAGYIVITLKYPKRKCYKAHRLAWLYIHGNMPDDLIDHKDMDRSNNRIDNLRDVTNSVNLQNISKPRADNKSSRYLGVSYCKRTQKYRASIVVNGKYKSLKYHDDEETAYNAYLKAKHELHEGYIL